MPYFNIVAETSENTVVTEYEPVKKRSDRNLSVCCMNRGMSICLFTRKRT